jgi:hypothetical protein
MPTTLAADALINTGMGSSLAKAKTRTGIEIKARIIKSDFLNVKQNKNLLAKITSLRKYATQNLEVLCIL